MPTEIWNHGTGGWRDLTADINVRTSGAGSPAWTNFGAPPFAAYKFLVGDTAQVNFHVNHDYLPGGQILLHLHSTTSGTDANVVRWQITYSVAKGHNQQNFDTTGTVTTIDTTPHGTAWRHYVTEMGSSITLTNVEPDSLILVQIKRITNGATDNTDDVLLLTADCHYQSDRSVTKNRAPNFNV